MATSDGVVYEYAVDPEHGGECTFMHKYRCASDGIGARGAAVRSLPLMAYALWRTLDSLTAGVGEG